MKYFELMQLQQQLSGLSQYAITVLCSGMANDLRVVNSYMPIIRPVTSLGHQGSEELSESGPNF